VCLAHHDRLNMISTMFVPRFQQTKLSCRRPFAPRYITYSGTMSRAHSVTKRVPWRSNSASTAITEDQRESVRTFVRYSRCQFPGALAGERWRGGDTHLCYTPLVSSEDHVLKDWRSDLQPDHTSVATSYRGPKASLMHVCFGSR
jgi:hypothetical protein